MSQLTKISDYAANVAREKIYNKSLKWGRRYRRATREIEQAEKRQATAMKAMRRLHAEDQAICRGWEIK